MEKSLFSQWVDKYFGPIIKKVVETVNGDKNPLTYLHKTMLKKDYSTSLKWGSLSSKGTAVAADVVAMDSSLPLKRRDSLNKAEGDIPKIGMSLYLNERTLTELDILQRTNNNNDKQKAIIQKLFGDTKKVVVGVMEQLEAMFLEALSTGYTTIGTDLNTGTTIRINFQHPDTNKYGVETIWSDTNAKPITDIENVLEKARLDGNKISYLLMDRVSWNNFRTKADVKELFAAGIGFSGSSIPTPTLLQVNDALKANYALEIQVVDRSVTYEKDGVRTVKQPFAENTVVFLTSLEVGTLTWSTLAEMNHRKKDVNYEVADDFILVSKYHDNNPLREWTTSQALAVPVIDSVDSIYLMDTNEAQTTAGQTEGDATITIYEDSTVTVENLVNALLVVGSKSASTDKTDVQLIKLVNKLSDANETLLKAILQIPVVDAGADDTANSASKAIAGTATAAGTKTIASTLWTQVSGPNTASFDDATALSTNATGLITGTYVFKLTATDSKGTKASDTVTITATVA